MSQNVSPANDDFTSIYHEYRNTVFGIALNYTKNNADANDILQEVFIKYYTNKKLFESKEHIKAWLIRVTINTCKKHLSSFWSKRTVFLDDSIPYEEVFESELLQYVISLPKNYRLVLHLYYYEGYSISDIADILKLKNGTVKMRLMRARRALEQKLKEEGYYEY